MNNPNFLPGDSGYSLHRGFAFWWRGPATTIIAQENGPVIGTFRPYITTGQTRSWIDGYITGVEHGAARDRDRVAAALRTVLNL